MKGFGCENLPIHALLMVLIRWLPKQLIWFHVKFRSGMWIRYALSQHLHKRTMMKCDACIITGANTGHPLVERDRDTEASFLPSYIFICPFFVAVILLNLATQFGINSFPVGSPNIAWENSGSPMMARSSLKLCCDFRTPFHCQFPK